MHFLLKIIIGLALTSNIHLLLLHVLHLLLILGYMIIMLSSLVALVPNALLLNQERRLVPLLAPEVLSTGMVIPVLLTSNMLKVLVRVAVLLGFSRILLPARVLFRLLTAVLN